MIEEIEQLIVSSKLLRPTFTETTVISIEGPDGAGKSSICRQLEEIEGYYFVQMPECYNEYQMKRHMLFNVNWITSAFYYLSGVMDTKRCLEEHIKKDKQGIYVMDRSFWSTAVLNWVRNRENVPFVLEIFEKISEFIPIPNCIILLDVSYEQCRKRIKLKNPKIQELDIVSEEEYKKEMEFYYWLMTKGCQVIVLDSNHMSLEETIEEIKKIVREKQFSE